MPYIRVPVELDLRIFSIRRISLTPPARVLIRFSFHLTAYSSTTCKEIIIDSSLHVGTSRLENVFNPGKKEKAKLYSRVELAL